MGSTWGPPGSCRPQLGPILAPQTLLSELWRYSIPVLVDSGDELPQQSKAGHSSICVLCGAFNQLQERHNERDSVSNHQPHDCLLNRLFKAQIKENIEAPRHWPLWEEFTGDRWIPRTKASSAENASIWWRHHASKYSYVWAISSA